MILIKVSFFFIVSLRRVKLADISDNGTVAAAPAFLAAVPTVMMIVPIARISSVFFILLSGSWRLERLGHGHKGLVLYLLEASTFRES